MQYEGKIAIDICKKTAETFAGCDWHRLSGRQKEIVKMLREAGYLIANEPANGFVGKVPKK